MGRSENFAHEMGPSQTRKLNPGLQSQGVSIDSTGLNIGVLKIELQDGRASKIMDDILEARMDRNSDAVGKTRKTTKGWKVVREKLVQPVAVQPINSLESVNHTISNTEMALPKPKPVKKLMMGKAKGWKVLHKRIERREFTEDLRQSNLQLNRMDEKSPMLSQLPRKSDKSQMPKAEDDDLRELEDESESYADYGTQMVELTKNLHIEKTKKKKINMLANDNVFQD